MITTPAATGTTKSREWKEVARAEPCLVCGKPDYCGRTADDELLRCMRGGETPSGYRHVRDHADGGKLFGRTSGTSPRRKSRPASSPTKPAAPAQDWNQLAERCIAAITAEQLDRLSLDLAVTVEALFSVGCGWYSEWGVFTFPERDAERRIIGISTRTIAGRKRFIPGGHRGLTIPAALDLSATILAVEGPTDVCACLSIGIEAVGRPSNMSGVDLLADLLRDAADVFIIGENDRKPDGREPGVTGAKATAAKLAARWGRAVKWALPPEGSKDLRAWLVQHDAHETSSLREVLV
jgi:hypothetical protein